MEIASFIVSVIALSLSGLTFYWVNIREKKNFYLLRVDRITSINYPEFALVNGGSKDILITIIECALVGSNDSSSYYPPQVIDCGSSDELLLQSGTAIHCKVRFTEPFTSSFAKKGVLREGTKPDMYEHKLRVDVSWISGNGHSYTASAYISKMGFRENGKICSKAPLVKKHDLLERALTNR